MQLENTRLKGEIAELKLRLAEKTTEHPIQPTHIIVQPAKASEPSSAMGQLAQRYESVLRQNMHMKADFKLAKHQYERVISKLLQQLEVRRKPPGPHARQIR